MNEPCENCQASFYRYYEDDERTKRVEYPAVIYVPYTGNFLCIMCGRKTKPDGGELLCEGDPKHKREPDYWLKNSE